MPRALANAALAVLLGTALGVGCGRAPEISPEPATSQIAPRPPGARPPIRVVVTNAGSTPLRMDPSLGLEAIRRDGPGEGARGGPREGAPESLIGLHLPPYPCECACDVASCPCASPAPIVLAPGASEERTWDGALRALRRGGDGRPCHERLDPPPGRYVLAACDESLVRCGTIEVELPTRDPIAIAIPEVSPPASCDDAARVRRAVRIALGAALLEGAPAASLADCDPAAARCSGVRPDPPEDALPSDRCAIDVTIASDRYEVHVTPAARDGAPVDLEVWIGAHAVPPAGRTGVADTRWTISSDRAIAIAGEPRRVSHTHGGEPAHIGSATFRITNRLDVPVSLAAPRVEWLTNAGARAVRAGAVVPAVLPPGSTTEVVVGFEAQPAYMAWHETFASRVTFDVGGRRLVATVEHHVIRREPIRRDPIGL